MTGTQNQIEMSSLALLFAMVGDISGAPFEFLSNNITRNNPNVKSPKDVPLFAPPRPDDVNKSRMTDDSALNLAIVKSMMEFGDKGYEECVDIVAKNLKEFYHKYSVVPGGYGGSFQNWAGTDDLRVERGSFVDGSAMRAPMIGMVYNTLGETLLRAEQSAMPTHSDPEGIKGAQAIAAAVYLARAGCSKDDIKTYIETKFDYDLDIPLSNYTEYMNKEVKHQAETCPVVVPMALRAFLESDSYEDCIQKTIFAGGDTDTTAAMTGGIAGVFFGMPKKFETQCLELIDEDAKKMVYGFQNFLKTRDTEPNKDELEAVMAEARLKKYVLDQYKAGKKTLPKNDPKFVDLLAKKEATRLYYEQVKEARQKKDGSEKTLADNKYAMLSNLTEAVKGNQDFKDKCSSYTAWPGKDITLKDFEAIRYKKKNGHANSKLFPLKRKVVDHALIPEKIVSIESLIKEEAANLFKKSILSEIRKELNVDEVYLQNIQDMKQKERDRLQRPRRGFWGTARDIIFGKNNAGRRTYDKKVREYEDKVSKLDKEIDESKKMVADAKKQIEDRFNVFKSGDVKDEAVKLKNEKYAEKAMAAVKEKFGITTERLKTLLGEDIAKNYIKDETVKKETEVKENVESKENVKAEPEKGVVENVHEPEVKENVEVSKETEVKENEKVNEVKVNDKLIKDEEQLSNHDIFFANSAVIQVMGKAVLQTMDDYVRKYDGNSPDNVAAGGKAIIDYIKNENNIEKPECERLIKTLALGNNAEFQKDSAKYSKFQKEYEALLANIGKTINEGQLADKDGDDVIKSDTVVEQAIEKYLPSVKKANDIPTNIENKKQVNWQKINNESKLDDNLTGFLK